MPRVDLLLSESDRDLERDRDSDLDLDLDLESDLESSRWVGGRCGCGGCGLAGDLDTLRRGASPDLVEIEDTESIETVLRLPDAAGPVVASSSSDSSNARNLALSASFLANSSSATPSLFSESAARRSRVIFTKLTF
jgi:hypothetical protein